jgi:hypothetical protein
MHVVDIAAKSNINPRKLCESFQKIRSVPDTDTYLAPLLRLLAVRGIFKEVSPDVFVNNRLSLLMDTGKAVEEILREYVNNLLQQWISAYTLVQLVRSRNILGAPG